MSCINSSKGTPLIRELTWKTSTEDLEKQRVVLFELENDYGRLSLILSLNSGKISSGAAFVGHIKPSNTKQKSRIGKEGGETKIVTPSYELI
ncbi:hypothetical protein DEO72_LG9g3626 [Vigna unguiculata]|uniref:Uncharacterized protein n=1 Tax=Vigna unguiculata TaxID=3917 RepID=A0A4D6N9G1_VIGUN|nr:hypothetical protein DEO72_LG9g3626 [Vigna unguiculata]